MKVACWLFAITLFTFVIEGPWIIRRNLTLTIRNYESTQRDSFSESVLEQNPLTGNNYMALLKPF